MKQRTMKVRQAAVVATCVVMAAGFGLAGASAASAASPSLHVKDGSTWTFVVIGGGGCEIDTFSSHGAFTFVSDIFGDAGTWSASGDTLVMKWTGGEDAGLKFKGTFNSSNKTYTGKLGGTDKGENLTANLLKGAVSGSC